MAKATKGKDVQELVMVPLTTEEHITRARQLTDKITERELLVEKHKDQKKKMKLAEDNIGEEIEELRLVVSSGQEQRPVDCVEEPDYKKGVITIRRKDTGAVVSTRQMTDEERQTHIEDLGAGVVANLRPKADLLG